MTQQSDSSHNKDAIDALTAQIEQLVTKITPLLPEPPDAIDFSTVMAARWRSGASLDSAITHGRGFLRAIHQLDDTELDDILCTDTPKEALVNNTQAFVDGSMANNALLWGPKGTGKSSLIRALLNHFSDQGLRVIEVEKKHLASLPEITDQLASLPYRFILFTDDLSFDAQDNGYKALKGMLDGSLSKAADNVLLYATSNRRHLLPESMTDNQDTRVVERNGEMELHHSDAVEEKISLSERFGLWLSFHPFNQSEYLTIVQHWFRKLLKNASYDEKIEKYALEWALTRGSRSGRVAKQFVIHYSTQRHNQVKQ